MSLDVDNDDDDATPRAQLQGSLGTKVSKFALRTMAPLRASVTAVVHFMLT